MPEQSSPPPTLKVVVYSDDASVRESVRLGLGRRPAADLAAIEYVDVATQWAVMQAVHAGDVDLVILDGEAAPSGGLGVCRTMKEEVFQAPPVLALLGRPQDQWLAAWARVDAVTHHPINPFALTEAATALLRATLRAKSQAKAARAGDVATTA